MKNDKTKILVISLVVVVAVLLCLVLYLLVLNPSIANYSARMQSEGYAYAIASVMEQASDCDVVPLTYGESTMNLIWVDCLQQSG